MSATVTNITQADDLGAATMTLAAVAGANAAMPSGSVTNINGIDDSNACQFLESGGNSTTANDFLSAHITFGASATYDLSGDDQCFIVYLKQNNLQFNTYVDAATSLWLILFSGGGTTDYARWEMNMTDFINGDWKAITMTGTPDTTGGTWDNTDVTGFGVACQTNTTGDNFGVGFSVDQLIYINGEAVFEDTGGAATVDWEDYYDVLYRFSGNTYHNDSTVELKPAYAFGYPVLIESDDITVSNYTQIFLPNDEITGGFQVDTADYYSLTINPDLATATHSYTDGVHAYASGTYDLTINSVTLTSGTLDVTRITYLNTRNVTIGGNSQATIVATIPSPTGTVDVSDVGGTLTITNSTSAIQWTADFAANTTLVTDSDIDITFAETDLSDITITLTASNTITVSPTTGSGTYDLSGLTTTGTVNLDNDTANNTTITLPAGTSNTVESPTTGGGTITVDSPAVTFTFNSDTASTLIRYFEDDSQTVVDSATGTTLAYEYPDTDPVDAEFLKQGYVPVNRQDIVPSDGASLDIIMDFDEAYNSAHGLTITTEYDYVRATKVLTINSDQEALDVRSSLADVIRTNTGYYNTPLLMVAIPGLTRVDLVDGATITSMATWKGAGMEMFDSADALNPVEKWLSIKSVGDITGATPYYRQTDSGNATASTLTSNVINEAFQYWDDADHDGTPTYDYSDYMVIKTFLAGTRQGRVDVLANSGLSALNSNLFTVPLSNASHDYAGTDPGISADLTLVAGGTVGGVAFSYEIVDGGTNSGTDIADQLHYNRITTPNGVIAGGTGLTWWELPDMVIYNATSVETERGYEEGTTPTLVGFYCSRSSADHPDFTRFQGDNGTYYTPAVTSNITITGLSDDGASTRLQICNVTAESASAWAATTAYAQADKVLRSTGVGTENTAGLYYVATTGGTSGGSEPTFPTVVGNTVVDGTVTWTCYAILYYDDDPASTGYSDSYTDGEEFDTGDSYRIKYADLNGSTSFKRYETTGIVGSTGFTVAATPVADSVYALNAQDGSDASITNKFSPDYTNNEIDLDTNSDFAGIELYAYYCYELTTTNGMYTVWGAYTALDTANYRNDTVIFPIYLDETAGFVKQTDSVRIFNDLGTRPARDPTSGGNGIEVNWRNPVSAYDGGGGGYTAADRSRDASIKTKTDSLTFTTAGQVDSNVKYVHDREVRGVGSAGDPWGPV